MILAQQLIKDGRTEDGIRLMELEVELAQGKVWLLRKLAETYLNAGRPEEALAMAQQGIERKPDDEKLLRIKAEAEHELSSEKNRKL
jgi:predicted Zn-dependent protease